MNAGPPFYNQTDFREILRLEFQSRNSKSSVYSMRAFARDMGVSAAQLSEVLSRKAGLSRNLAAKMATKLGLKDEDFNHFVDLVSYEHARSEIERNLAKLRIEKRRQGPVRSISEQTVSLLTKWYYPALIELLELYAGIPNRKQICEALGINRKELDSSISDLLNAGFLTKRGTKFLPRVSHLVTQSQTPSDKIRSFHREVLKRAIDAIDGQPIDVRNYRTSTIAFRSESMAAACSAIEDFDTTFVNRFSTEKDPDSVYCLSIQYFRIAKKEPGI